MIIRPMMEHDVKTVAFIEKACFRSPWTERAFRSELRNAVAHYYVAEDRGSGTPAGYLGMWIMFQEAHITNVAVMPDFRRQGLGRRLMLYAMEQALLQGATEMTLEVRETNLGAQALYEGLDFTFAGRRKRYYSDTNEDALILWNRDIGQTHKQLHVG